MCMNAKKAPFKNKTAERSTIPGERIYSDVKELSTASIEGHMYAVCFIDDATRRGVTYAIAKKSEVIDKWREFLETECIARGKAVRYLRSDNGGEYISDEFHHFCASRGIRQEFSPPRCQSMNGVAEVYWRVTFNLVRAILWDQQRPQKYWACALRMSNDIRNHLMTTAVQDMPPEAAWTGRTVDVSHFRVPLSTCWAYMDKETRDGTLGRRRMKGVLVGYATHSPCYMVYEPVTGQLYNRRYADVEFDERSKVPEEEEERANDKDAKKLKAFFEQLELLTAPVQDPVNESATSTTTPTPPTATTMAAADNDSATAGDETTPDETKWYRTQRNMKVAELATMFNTQADIYLLTLQEYDGWYQQLKTTSSVVSKGSDVPIPEPQPPPTSPAQSVHRERNRKRKTSIEFEGVHLEASKGVRRSNRTRAKESTQMALYAHQQELVSLWQAHLAQVRALPDPKSERAAMQRPDAQAWKASMLKEWTGLWAKECFKQVEYKGQKLHHMMWVFKTKKDGTKKCRLVFDGRRQDPATYDNINSPTMKLTSFRVLVALATQNSWPIWADDAVQAFLNAKRPTDRPLHAAYPNTFRTDKTKCLLVQRQLYGLHDAPMGWFLEVKQHMLEQGFEQSKNDACLFHKPGCYVVCHVDDFASTGEPAKVAEFRKRIHAKFNMTGGRIKDYYGLDIHQDLDKGYTDISCADYLSKMLHKLDIKPKSWPTPMEQHLDLPVRTKAQTPDSVAHKRFRQIVGCAMHPAITCRPDASAAVRALAVHLQNPGEQHLRAAVRLVQYLHGTRAMTLRFSQTASLESSFFGTCDAAHNVTQDSRGITGWAYQLSQGAISWKCRTQGLTALSSTEAELIAVDEAAREAQYLHKLLQDFDIKVSDILPTFLGQDNMSTIALIKSSHWNARTKHVSLRFHHTGNLQRNGEIKTAYLSTDQMPADMLTKPLAAEAFRRHRAVLLGHKTLDATWRSPAPATKRAKAS